jgi:large subunit ribosomal protein L25
MATNATLGADKREVTGKGVARKLRQAGRVPVVLYGRDLESVHLSVDAREAEHLFHAISVDNTIVSLDVKGEKEPYQTLVREIQTHPWKANLLHIDFLRIQQGVAVDVDVPIDLIGVPVGVKLDGGILEQSIHELAIRCIPSMIPESIRVDVSQMQVNDVLHVFDIQLGEGIELTISADQTICSVAPPRIEEVVAPVAGLEAPVPGAEAADEADATDRDD